MSGRTPECRGRGPAGVRKRPREGRAVFGSRSNPFSLIKVISLARAARLGGAERPASGAVAAPRAPWGPLAGCLLGARAPAPPPHPDHHPENRPFRAGAIRVRGREHPRKPDPARRSGSVGVPHPPAGPRIPQMEVMVETRNFGDFWKFPGISRISRKLFFRN